MTSVKLVFLLFSIGLLSVGVVGEWRWSGKVAVVTGASSGIGAEVAVSLADRGVIVVGLARREEKLKELKALTNGTIHTVVCDMYKEDDILNAFRWVEENLGGVDLLINNAGIRTVPSLITGNTKDWQNVMDLNVVALSVSTREALKSMRKRGDDGHIININSITGREIPKFKGVTAGMYSASKFAVTALTQSLAFELSNQNSKIKVSSLSPGLVSTGSTQTATKKIVDNEGVSPQTVLPYVQSSDIAEAILYILSTKSNVQIAELTIKAVGTELCG